MPSQFNFLLGYGERLTEPIDGPPLKPDKNHPYSFREARTRLQPMLNNTVSDIRRLPALACPGDRAVAILRLHPEFIAKSYFPARLLNETGLQPIGSRPAWIRPQKWTRKGEPERTETTDLFVAAPRRRFSSWAAALPHWTEKNTAAVDISHIEEIRAPTPTQRVVPVLGVDDEVLLEVVLHASADRSSQFILEGFLDWLRTVDAKPHVDRRLYVGGLCFVPVEALANRITDVATFTFVRAVRRMPKLRMLKPPILRAAPRSKRCELPLSGPLAANTRVAIFDGGLPTNSPLSRWVTAIDAPGVGDPLPDYQEHGQQVSSALLFGSIPETDIPVPYSAIDHYRVLDASSADDPFELYDVLQRISNVVGSQHYDLINVSIGPELPVEDTDVHAWTAFLDQHLEDGNVLAAVAIGNGGENDELSGNARIQVPSDSVNALAVGACDSQSGWWKRATYSSLGPGRTPGIVKPDCLGFGGSDGEPFFVVRSDQPTRMHATLGTSFATPSVLRIAAGIRAFLGPVVSPLALKALLIHCAESGDEERKECGWGRAPAHVDDVIICPDGVARVLYQGELTPGKFLRAQIPLPLRTLEGFVSVRATFCYATRTDPQHPGSYTRSGLDVRFRPHDSRFTERESKGSLQPDSKPFFQLRDFSTELELRRDAHKWETTLHREKRLRATSLRNPVFDIHYVAREGGGSASAAPKIRYALVVSVIAPKTIDVYDQIRRRYATTLIPLQPVITVPVRV